MITNRYDISPTHKADIRTGSRLLYVSSAKYGGDWHSTLHTHQCTELFFVTGGMGQFQIEDQLHPVTVGDMVIINPNVNHTEVGYNSNPLEYIVIGADGLELSHAQEDSSNYRIINCQNLRDKILFYLHQMLKEINTKETGYETICQDLMEILLITLSRQTDFSAALTPIEKKSTRLCTLVKRYIDAHFKENIDLEHLSKVTHVSKYHLVHAFSKEYGISPMSYLTTCRIEEAKQLLKNDDYTLAVISRMLGFSSPSYFSQTFKKNTGESPNEYRKRQYS